VVADWIRKAEIMEAIARGRKAFETGDVVSHEDALERGGWEPGQVGER
jgi:predicted transcriptional regulator